MDGLGLYFPDKRLFSSTGVLPNLITVIGQSNELYNCVLTYLFPDYRAVPGQLHQVSFFGCFET